MLTREEILVIYEAGPEAVIALIQRLETIIEKQASQISELEERVRVLEARLNQNSQNSSKPPSTDTFCKRKNLNLRVGALAVEKNLVVKKVILEELLK